MTTQSVRVGEAKISATDAGCDSACDAISGAGYKPSCSMAKPGHAGHAGGSINGASGSASANSAKPAADMPGKPGTPGADAQRSQTSGQNSTHNSGHASGGQQRTPDVDVKPTPAVASTKH